MDQRCEKAGLIATCLVRHLVLAQTAWFRSRWE